jgi:hypothetical protein
MLRHCNGSDPNLKDDAGNVGNCGATFDDVNHWTTCPHGEFPISADVWRMLARQDAAALQLPGEVAEDGSRDSGLPGWNQSAANGRWYPPTQTLAEASGVNWTGPDDAGRYFPPGAANEGPGEGWHRHDDGSWHPDDDNTEGRKEVANARYLAAAHAVQSGIAFLMQRNPRLGEAKHLRVGIDTMKVEQGGLAALLIAKGVFTEVEYYEAMADAMEREKAMDEAQLSKMYGRPVSLS